ncbi:heavy metal translocating P-type ATPase [Acidithiobacillus sulfuriphilus]|uniref:heavy metal translocating P-type ATPase n=1 Tax=Acidithiobacillus sulfuriphilus TaxID=1867749 RepID=UPI003F62E5BD
MPTEEERCCHLIAPDQGSDREGGEHVLTWQELSRILFVALCALGVWLHFSQPWLAPAVLGVIGLLVGGWPIYKEAGENLLARRMTMELSMVIAIAAAAAIGQFLTALVITLFVLVAEVLEGMTVYRGRRALVDLLEFLPRSAFVIQQGHGGTQEVPITTLQRGDVLLVYPGAKIPVDGTVLGGQSAVDQSRITGESLPVEKTPGDLVYAGSINQLGALEIRVDRMGRDTSYGKIVEVVEQAERSRAPVQRLADRIAGYLVYFALSAAFLTYLFTRDLQSTIAVIIVAGACGIAAGTPLAILGGIAQAARLGAIIKGGAPLETLGHVDTVAIDKTGTVTMGQPAIERVLPMAGVTADEVLLAAATAEWHSEHPLGQAIVGHARALGLVPAESTAFHYLPGLGIQVTAEAGDILVGNLTLMRTHGIIPPPAMMVTAAATSEVFVAQNGRLLGAVVIVDTIRPEARQAMDTLRSLGIRTTLLSGDSAAVADAVGQQLRIDTVQANLLPEDKLAVITQMVAQGQVVAMVGDGVNDAPALTKASVGIAMGSGTDVARESASIVLLGNDLARFVDTVVLARRVRRTIWQNFAGTIVVDATGILLAALGFIDPLMAAFIHVSSEMLFILNSARLLPLGVGKRTVGVSGNARGDIPSVRGKAV